MKPRAVGRAPWLCLCSSPISQFTALQQGHYRIGGAVHPLCSGLAPPGEGGACVCFIYRTKATAKVVAPGVRGHQGSGGQQSPAHSRPCPAPQHQARRQPGDLSSQRVHTRENVKPLPRSVHTQPLRQAGPYLEESETHHCPELRQKKNNSIILFDLHYEQGYRVQAVPSQKSNRDVGGQSGRVRGLSCDPQLTLSPAAWAQGEGFGH